MNKLNILWTTGEKDVAMRMIFIYVMDSKAMGWWEEIDLIIWGPSAKLAGEDPAIRKELDYIMQSGIRVEACKGCADSYGVTKGLGEMGITVRYMGDPLTKLLKSGEKLVTF
jgi:hypothetical protein